MINLEIEIAILSSTNFSTNQVTTCISDYRTELLLAKCCYDGNMGATDATAGKAPKAWVCALPRFWVSKGSYKKEPVEYWALPGSNSLWRTVGQSNQECKETSESNV